MNGIFLEQGRLNGLFCDYTEEDKFQYLLKCKENNVVNIEMESLCFASFLNRANLKGNLNGNQVKCRCCI